MTTAIEYLKANQVFFIATANGSSPRVRPFGFTMERNGALYLCSGKSKAICRQLTENPEVEASACSTDRTWLRIRGRLAWDDSREAKIQAFEEAPQLLQIYPQGADDENFVTLYFTEATAMLFSFSAPPKEIPVL